MPKSFGYLNEGNPLTIKDNEAQIMVNCAVERGWIEYKDYPINTDTHQSVPNREITLPDDYRSRLRIVNNEDSYSLAGLVKLVRPDGSYSDFILNFKDYGDGYSSSDVAHVEAAEPVLATSEAQLTNGYYVQCTSTTSSIGSGQTTINLMNPSVTFTGGVTRYFPYDSNFIKRSILKSVTLNGNQLNKDKFTILNSGYDSPVIVLAEETPTRLSGNTIVVTWNYLPGWCFFTKESRDVFYAFTIKERASTYSSGGVSYSNSNYGKESAPILRTVHAYPEGTTSGFLIFKVSSILPTDTGAITPELMMYRMPFGGSEYLFDRSFYTAPTNEIDMVLDEDLDYMLETEGNSTNLLTNTANCIMVHNDRLFVATGRLLVYSKPGQFDQFPADNFYAFQDTVLDICKYDSNLAVFTQTKSYIIYGAGTDGFVISEIDWKTKNHIRNCARAIYTKLISLTSEEEYALCRRNSVLLYNHRYAQDISLRIKDSLAKGVTRMNGDNYVVDSKGYDFANRNNVVENRYYVAELRYYESATATDAQVKTFCIVYDVIADGFCLYDTSLKDFNNQVVFKYRTKEFKMSTSPTPQAQYHKGIYVKGKGTFKVNVYSDGELLTSLTHMEADASKPLRIILHNMGNKRASTISLEFIGTQGAQIHDWEVYD